MSIQHIYDATADLYKSTTKRSGIPKYSATASTADVDCRVEEEFRHVQDRKGSVIITDVVILMDESATVDIDYKIIVGTDSYVVVKARKVKQGVVTNDHWELLCKGI